MKFFTPDFILFFQELEKNNHKDWFTSQKKRYENSVKKPFELLVAEMIKRMKVDFPALTVEPKDCIFRINRDIRFSKDKTPYKTQTSALITEGGRKARNNPGIYLEITAKYVRIYGGIYEAEKNELEDIRYYISNNLTAFKKAYSDKNFIDNFGSIRGEKSKILPPDLKEPAAKEPLIFNKQFYYFSEFKSNILLDDNLVETIYNRFKVSMPITLFLRKALND